MLRIFETAIGCCERVGPLAAQIGRQDRSLADQLRRAMASVAMNVAEGAGSQGGNQRARYFTALGSARKVEAALRVTAAFGYVGGIEEELARDLDRIRATLWRVTHPRR